MDPTDAPRPTPVDPAAAKLIDDMMRLGLRDYAEVGIPMFLVAEDLRGPSPPPTAATSQWQDIATLFDLRARTLADGWPDLGAADIARLVEVFADRHLMTATLPSFSAIPEAIARRRRVPAE